MRGMAIALALLPFVLIELALRCLTPTTLADPLVDLHQLQPLFVLNRQTNRWEIPPARFNFFEPDSFLADKPPASRRIFVLGGSTVQGSPYSIQTSFATWLRLKLQAASPATQFEVVNCGGISYASYRVAKILDQVLGHQPDAIVIYTGHNEFLEDREYEQIRELSRVRQWITRAAAQWRTASWLQDQLRRSDRPRSLLPSEVDARLDHHDGMGKYVRDGDWRTGVEQHFSQTLQRMIVTTRRAGVPLVLCVPARELVDTAPFKIVPPPSLPPQESAALQAAEAVFQDLEQPTEQRLAAAQTALAIDPEHAGAHYVAGRLYRERGDADPARKHLVAAADFDVCPLRATTPIIRAVIELAQSYDVPLVHTPELLDQRDWRGIRLPDGIADPEYFVDHVHPTIGGHQAIAAAIAAHIESLGWYERQQDAEARYQRLAQSHLATLGEAYYGRGQQRLEGLRRWAAGRAGKLGSKQ
jgi:lysophospholipase L1-like esterase